jgi:hypothetical protein
VILLFMIPGGFSIYESSMTSCYLIRCALDYNRLWIERLHLHGDAVRYLADKYLLSPLVVIDPQSNSLCGISEYPASFSVLSIKMHFDQ